ncbi:MAG TPA: hypothetical protein VE309_03035 [Caulobacteraceae bacterium]|jgi:hypothetical protein|nr:hypothetical protein [Caulobacteraceae bacterium]
MLGPAAAGLIGLLFVVVTLTSGRERSETARGQALYLTPTALQFAVVMTFSAVAMAPRMAPVATASIFSLIALVGLVNATLAAIGIASPRAGMEPPHWSDFWMYGVTPVVGYLALCAACVEVWMRVEWAAYALAGVLLTLLLVGIRNAWDLVTWIAPMRGG